MKQRNFTHHVRNLTCQDILQWDTLSFMNIIITQQMMNTNIWTLVQKVSMNSWTMKTPLCLHIWSIWLLHLQLHTQDLPGHAQYHNQDLQKSKTRSQVAEKPPQDSFKNEFQHTLTHSQPGKHYCYLHQPC